MKKKFSTFRFKLIKKFLWNHYRLLIIVAVTILSLGSTAFLYFSYEDFNTLYLYQDPIEAKAMLQLPEFARHLGGYYLAYPLFSLFHYQPFGYYLVTLFLACLASILFYIFLLQITKQSRLSFIAAVIYASSYYGIQAYTWNMTSGLESAVSLIIMLIILMFFLIFIQKRSKRYYFFSLGLFVLFLYFFLAKGFILILELFGVYFIIQKKKKLLQNVLSLIPFILFTLSLYISHFASKGNMFHVSIDAANILVSFLGTIANLFIPSDFIFFLYNLFSPSSFIVKHLSFNQFDAVFGGVLLIFFGVVGYFMKKNREKAIRLFFVSFSLLTIYIFCVFVASITESGIFVNIMESYQHSLQPITIWSSMLTGILLVYLSKRQKFIGIFCTIFIVLVNIILSNIGTYDLIVHKSKNLSSFYFFVTNSVPRVTKPSVFYISYALPRPFYPFTSGNPLIHAQTYLAGFYGTNYRNIILADDFFEAQQLLKQNKIPLDRFYYFYIGDQKISYLTPKLKKFESNETHYEVTLNSNNVSNQINLPSFYPFYLRFNLTAIPDFSSILISDKNKEYDAYFSLLFQNLEESKNYTVESQPIQSTDTNTLKENVLDHNMNTYWVPKFWNKDGVSLTIDMHQEKQVSHVAWEVSRSFPWAMRAPTAYEIYLSSDKMNWKKVVSVTKDTPLLSGDYFYDSFSPQKAQYVKIVITKTFGNYPPAVDEVEIFGNTFEGFDYNKYFAVESNPLQHISSSDLLNKVYNILFKPTLNFYIDQQIDGNSISQPERQKSVSILSDEAEQQYMIPLPADGYTLKAIQFKSAGFPLSLVVKNLSLQYIPVNQLEAVGNE